MSLYAKSVNALRMRPTQPGTAVLPSGRSMSPQAAAEYQRRRGLYTLSCGFGLILSVVPSADGKVLLNKYLIH